MHNRMNHTGDGGIASVPVLKGKKRMNRIVKAALCLMMIVSVLLMTGCAPDHTWRGAVTVFSAGEGFFRYTMPNELTGYIDSRGNVISEAQWSQAAAFSQGLAAVSRDGKCGFINTKGEIVIPLEYSTATSFTENGLAIVSKSGLYGFINMQGEVVIPLKYEQVSAFSEGLACVKWNDRYHYIRPDGTQAFKDDFARARSFSNGMAYVVKWSGPVSDSSFINLNGAVMFESSYQYDFGSFSAQGLCTRSKGIDDYGFVDQRGNVVIPAHWDYAWAFDENNLARVKDHQGRVGMIGLDGSIVVDCEYQHINTGRDGLYQVRLNDKYGMIDMQGNVLIECVYDDLSLFAVDGVFRAAQNGKYGFLNSDGSVRLPLQYEDATAVSGGAAAVKTGGKWQIIDLDGNVLAK